ncbi:hypothetical protein WJX84_007666 [Apatococcus fuscideae]|uniref:Uncharacterized protein n=1 Tax=Apatococcus fuscideae TaxID=2026836 RepID=A0AAW1SN95_9CHLO
MTKHWAATLTVLTAAICITWGSWSSNFFSNTKYLQQVHFTGIELPEALRWHAAERNDTAETFARLESDANVPDDDGHLQQCGLHGQVQDCGCDYNSVNRLNAKHLNPVLSRLVQTPFFRYFKVSLWCDCPFWLDDGMCALRDCSVCECPEDDEVARLWKQQESASCSGSTSMVEAESAVKRESNPATNEQLGQISNWRGFNNPWLPDDDQAVDFSYVNLVENPERYTGYKGEHPHRVWNQIYSHSCFQGMTNASECTEQRVFYKLISGMHASISAHIAADYLLDEANGTWGPSLEEFERRLGTPATKSHLENLYFAYLFVLRAVMKAGPALEQADLTSGLPVEDKLTRQLMDQLVTTTFLKQACPLPFDEAQLWKGEGAQDLQAQLRSGFHDITRVMDCVGCEKCKLWGKLQLLGIATSLKVLFTPESCSMAGEDMTHPICIV